MVLGSEKQTLLSSAKTGEGKLNQPEKPDNFDQRAHADPNHDGDEDDKDEHAAAQRAKEKAVAENAAAQKAAVEKNGDMQTASRPTDEDAYELAVFDANPDPEGDPYSDPRVP